MIVDKVCVIKYQVFLDYDDMPLEDVIADAKKLNEKYNLRGFEVYMTTPPNPEIGKIYASWHVRFYKLFDNIEPVRRIINDSRCHERFKEYARFLGFQVLRERPSTHKAPIIKTHVVTEGAIINLGAEVWSTVFKFGSEEEFRRVLNWLRGRLQLDKHGMKAYTHPKLMIIVYSRDKDSAFKVGEWIRHNNPVTLETWKKLFYSVYGFEANKMIYASWCPKCRRGLGKHYEHI
ncbi:MAG: hypothetical protein NDF54_10925 [archaeon GB-1867-035]|nr:hypothetical protein [Candidatus Culexmicrobium profundum]